MSLALVTLAALPRSTAKAADCDDNAVIRCGVAAANIVQKCQENQAGNVQAVWQAFGIADCGAALNGLVVAEVGSDNNVYVNGQVVATNAVTAGRQNMPGSTAILGGAFYQRPPSVSFRSARLSALARIDNGVFKYAIIESCGNPVKATPTAQPQPTQPQPSQPQPPQPQQHPALTITKAVSKAIVPLNQDFDYTIAVKNTGDQTLTNVTVSDTAPAGVMFVNNASGSTTQFTTTIAKIDPGASQNFTIHARITQQIKDAIVNTACVTSTEMPNKNCANAQNQLACDVKPELPLNSPECKSVVPVVKNSKPQPQPTQLADTGPEDLIGIGSSVSIAGYAGSMAYRRLRQKFLGL